MAILSSLFKKFGSNKKDDGPYLSVVLLLRKSRFRTQEEIQRANLAAAQELDPTAHESAFFTVQKDQVTFVKSGSLLVNVLQAKVRYTPPALPEILRRSDQASRDAWEQHQAWLALDLLNTKDVSEAEGLAWLVRLSKELLDSECTAVFIPQLLRTLPNNGVAAFGIDLMLRKILPEAISKSAK